MCQTGTELSTSTGAKSSANLLSRVFLSCRQFESKPATGVYLEKSWLERAREWPYSGDRVDSHRFHRTETETRNILLRPGSFYLRRKFCEVWQAEYLSHFESVTSR